VRLTANLYFLASRQGQRLPTVIMSHGWGGTAAFLEPQARAFAAAGYFVVAFDYRGWGESDSRVILTGPAPDAARRDGPRFTAEVLEVREVVDPLEQAEDIFNVIQFPRYAPVDDVAGAKGCAMLFIAAEHEELFSNQEHPALAHQRAAGPKRYVVTPRITHYGIYGEAREQATQLAIDWFDQHLKL